MLSLITDQLNGLKAGLANVQAALTEMLYEHKTQSLTGMCAVYGLRYTAGELVLCLGTWND